MGDRQARIQERADPGDHAGRHQPRRDDQRRGRGGNGVRLAGHRQAAVRRHHLPRLPDRAGSRRHRRRDDHHGQPVRRHILRADRSAHSPGGLTVMSVTTLPFVSDPPRRKVAFWRSQSFPLIPTLILLLIAFVAIFADVLAPHDPQIGSLARRFRPPAWLQGGSMDYFLGTDHVGRDVLSRLIFGARVSMIVGLPAVFAAGAIGTVLGIVSGYLGGWVDQVIMRITDTWLALPALTFAIYLAAIVGPSMWNIVFILGLTYWTRYARVVRGEVLSLREREFVRLAIVAGCSKWTIMSRHILPNVVNSAVVLASLMLGVVIIT